ncbi:hypothetical protein BC830DRAFT_728986 [Chytriomyces sp. MP71]|nr:hypothetical protein BC830DRAFT_728986 [Chytriomyces sp. MP71]
MQSRIRDTLRTEGFMQVDNFIFDAEFPLQTEADPAYASLLSLKFSLVQLCLLIRLPFESEWRPCRPIYHSLERIDTLEDWIRSSQDETPNKDLWRSLIPGEWKGFYADYQLDLLPTDQGVDTNFQPCDGPMYNMHFFWTSPDLFQGAGPLSRILNFNATGIDDWGDFEIIGRVLPSTMRVFMRKTYRAGARLSWELDGVMKEFGIVGSWGSHSGTFYMWKVQKEEFQT